jgi:hypothetical protein
MANRKPKQTTLENKLVEQIITDISKPKKFSLFTAEDFEKHLYEPLNGFEMNEVVIEYKKVNEAFLKALEMLEIIYLQESYTKSDVKYLQKLDFYYHKRRLHSKYKSLLNEDIFKNILQATLSETYIKSMEFFESDNHNDWKRKLDKFRAIFIRFGGENILPMISLINSLYDYLVDLHKDFIADSNEFKEWFYFPEIIEAANEIEDIYERKEFVENTIIDCKEFCLKEEYFVINKSDEEEFIQKCEKLLELIELQIQNDIKNTSNLPQKSTPTIKVAQDNTIQNSHLITDNTIQNSIPQTDITLNRQFLALYYLLNEVDKEAFARNKAEIARFIHFLIGKSPDNIYKLTKKPLKDPSERTSKKYQSDIKFVKETFLKLGLDKIARQIENDNLVG